MGFASCIREYWVSGHGSFFAEYRVTTGESKQTLSYRVGLAGDVRLSGGVLLSFFVDVFAGHLGRTDNSAAAPDHKSASCGGFGAAASSRDERGRWPVPAATTNNAPLISSTNENER
jgi:hypothetical protein